jgi:hypothetical protein
MKLRFASIVFVSALVAAGCGKDKSDKAPAKDEVAGKDVKPLLPGAGYHSDTSGTEAKSENAITGDPSGDEPDPVDDVEPERPRDPEPKRTEPKKKKPKKKPAKKTSGGGTQKKSLESGAGGLKLNDIAIAPDVIERVPHGVKRRYSEPPEVFWCWTNFSNTGDETKVTHVWRHKNKVRTRIEVTVGAGKRWRSWSRHKPGDKSGEWSCEILDPDGKRLGRASVTVGG